MKVEKRNGNKEDVSFDKILNRIRLLCDSNEFSKKLDIDPSIIAQKVCSELYDGVTTTELDILSSETAISLYEKGVSVSVIDIRKKASSSIVKEAEKLGINIYWNSTVTNTFGYRKINYLSLMSW